VSGSSDASALCTMPVPPAQATASSLHRCAHGSASGALDVAEPGGFKVDWRENCTSSKNNLTSRACCLPGFITDASKTDRGRRGRKGAERES